MYVIMSKNDIVLKETNKGKGNLVICSMYILTHVSKKKPSFIRQKQSTKNITMQASNKERV